MAAPGAPTTPTGPLTRPLPPPLPLGVPRDPAPSSAPLLVAPAHIARIAASGEWGTGGRVPDVRCRWRARLSPQALHAHDLIGVRRSPPPLRRRGRSPPGSNPCGDYLTSGPCGRCRGPAQGRGTAGRPLAAPIPAQPCRLLRRTAGRQHCEVHYHRAGTATAPPGRPGPHPPGQAVASP